MSNALEIYSRHRRQHTEEGAFSEEFTVDPTGLATIIKGFFEDAYISENRDQGQVRQQTMKAKIILATEPENIIERVTTVLVRGEIRTIQKIDLDSEGLIRMWLL